MPKFSIEGETLSSLSERALKAAANSSLVIAVRTSDGWLILNRTRDPVPIIYDIRGEYRDKLLYVAESNISKKFALVTLGESLMRVTFLDDCAWRFFIDSYNAKIALNDRGNAQGLTKFSTTIDKRKEPRNTSIFIMPSHSQVMLFQIDHYNRTNDHIIHKWTMGDDVATHRDFAIMGSLYVCEHSPIKQHLNEKEYAEVFNSYPEDSYPRKTTEIAQRIENILNSWQGQDFKRPSVEVLDILRSHLMLDNLDTKIFLETAVLDERMGFRRFDGYGNEVEAIEREKFWRWTEVRSS